MKIELPYPPSVNKYWLPNIRAGRFTGFRVSMAGKEYKDKVYYGRFAEFGQIEPMTGPLIVKIEMYPPDKRKRDCDNVLKATLDSVALVTREKTDTYVQAAQSLLMAVEERRNEMQSPARKIYRRLRDRDRLSFWGVLLGVVVMIAGIVLAVWPGLFATLLARLGIRGSWFAGAEYNRSADRLRGKPDLRSYGVGFRITRLE